MSRLISCIMPTANRRPFVPQAIKYFLRQTYQNAELVIVDDGQDSISKLVPTHPRIRYERIASGLTLGAKRNLCVELAKGELIAHWDDDDWYRADRLELQEKALKGVELCGVRQPRMIESTTGRVFVYEGLPFFYPHGATMCYTRGYWESFKFPDIAVGSTFEFVVKRPGPPKGLPVPGSWYCGVEHRGNVAPKHLVAPFYRFLAPDASAIVGEDWPFYRAFIGGNA